MLGLKLCNISGVICILIIHLYCNSLRLIFTVWVWGFKQVLFHSSSDISCYILIYVFNAFFDDHNPKLFQQRSSLWVIYSYTITCRIVERTNTISSFSNIIIRVYCAIFLWWLRGKTPSAHKCT